ncbi:hypothetical protein LR032_00230 [Candidatus Bipolaricaulota bacterium]|nr:hypothetical protein [Candidatus Bipolaricaulota bacterium]
MNGSFFRELISLFRLRSALLLCCGTILFAAFFDMGSAPFGTLIGYGLFALNAFFLYESGRSLINVNSSAKGRVIASLASLSRILFLGIALGLTAQLGTATLLFACGGLLLGQLNLQLSCLFVKRGGRCSII